jgi:hypothetical protein
VDLLAEQRLESGSSGRRPVEDGGGIQQTTARAAAVAGAV